MFNYKLYPGRNKDIIEYEEENLKTEITIVMPFFNGKQYIDETINCVLNQTFPYWELIIVDDGSTEKESIEKIKEIETIDKRIKVVLKENGGPAMARDYGAALASKDSKYLLFLDNDDLINKTYLECAYWTLQTNKDASWAYTDVVNFQEENYKWIKWFDCEIEKTTNLLVNTALIRKEDFLEVNGYELKEKAVNEDWNLWLKLLAKGKKPVRMNYDGFWYRRKSQGSELQRSKQNQKRALEIVKKTGQQIKRNVKAKQYPEQDYDWQLMPEDLEQIEKCTIKENNKINILMIIPWMVTGGADKFNLDLIKKLPKDKFNIVVVTTQPSINDWRQDFEEYATAVYDLTTFLNKEYWLAFINNLIRQYRINLIFNTNSYIGYSMIPYLKSRYPEIPIVDYVHMEEWYNRCGGYSRDSSSVASCIDKTLVCNKNTENILVNHFGRNKNEVETIYIGVDENKFDPEKYNKEEILKELNINNSEHKYILSYICRIDLQKRPLLLVEILKKLKEKRKDFICVVAGSGPLLAKMRDVARRYDVYENMILVGNVKETEKIYKISDITINCSIKEGLALTAYESLSMGVPVVTSDVGGQAELVNNEVGAVVPCLQKETEIMNYEYKEEEINPYVEKIDEILNNLDDYKAKCRQRILKGFTIDQMINNMEKQLTEIKENPNVEKIETGKSLKKAQDICKELITKSYITTKEEYNWLCNELNRQYFKGGSTNENFYGGYDYFETPMGKFRLKVINVAKKLHIYEQTKSILRKIRRN